MSYHSGEPVHVLSTIFGKVVYGYTGKLLFREWDHNTWSDHVWFVQTTDNNVYKIDVTKTLVIRARTHSSAGTLSPEDMCAMAKIPPNEENILKMQRLNAFNNIHIDFNAKEIKISTSPGQTVIFPLSTTQMANVQRHADGASILTEIRRDNTIYIASERAAEAARTLTSMSTPSVGGKEELPSLFIQFDYK